MRQAGIALQTAPPNAFLDVPDYAWYKDDVYTAVQIGLMKETAGFVFPDQKITRGEFAFMAGGVMDLNSCEEVDTDEGGIPDFWEVDHNLDPLAPEDEAPFIPDYQEEYPTPPVEEPIDEPVGEPVEEPIEEPTDTCPCSNNPNTNDSDGDGILDPCDEDLDGDGVPNIICLFDDNGEPDPAKVAQSQDNCVFVINEEQSDQDADHIGDLCCPCADNPNQNNTDGDSFIDACDMDLDNDGIPNALCLFDDSGVVDPEKLAQSEDNCVFIENADQIDSDFNVVGDLCEPEDLCPTVPEDLDGVEDEDGCPEVDDQIPDQEEGIYISSGPLCNFADFESDLLPGDLIMTAITDTETHDIILSRSQPVPYNP